MNDKFLRTVARYYKQRETDLAAFTFVCPNKRSAMFLKRCFQQESSGTPVFMPRFAALGAWVARQAPSQVPDRWEALFLLYSAYREVLAERGRQEQAGDFDRFIFWGDIILADFDDIDRSLADPQKIYTNLYKLRSIQADYLTEEQKEVIRLLWGDTPLTREVDTFWLHTGHDGDDDAPSARFIALWEVLGDLYKVFRAKLAANGLATAGMVTRRAMETTRARGLNEIASDGRKYVFVGLSEIYPAELAILERYRDAGVAEFIWDTAVVDSFRDTAESAPRGIAAVGRLARHLPAPCDFPRLECPPDREITVVGVPSCTGQAKMAAAVVKRLIDEGAIDPADALNTAIVLPATELLTPLMLALPESLQQLNVTMTVPFAHTTFATLLRSVTSMQARIRRRRGQWTFFYADVLEIMAHPHVRIITPQGCEKLRRYIAANSLYNIQAADIIAMTPELEFIFRPVAQPYDMAAVYDYLIGFLGGLDAALRSRLTAGGAESSTELLWLTALRERLETLRRLVDTYGVEMGESTLFMIFERLLQSGMVAVSGAPLKGLQLMGALETRALDFDNIIFMSLNERTFPKRDRLKTMIPAALRRGYGLPAPDRDECAMNYHFYRALSRAHRAWLIYDTRPAAIGGAERSRYIAQILNGPLSADAKVRVSESIVEMSGDDTDRRVISVPKSPAVLRQLSTYLEPHGRKLSASALKQYMSCPLAFYLKYLSGFRSDDAPSDFLTPADTGDMFHATMEALYEPLRGTVITDKEISDILNSDRIREILIAEYVKKRPSAAGLPFEELPAEGIIVIAQIELQVRGMLQAEIKDYVPFEYVGGEDVGGKFDGQWSVTPDLTVNFTMKIDRIDRVTPGQPQIRFIDYKTGSDLLTAGNFMENLFNGNHSRQAIFQLLLYREAYADMVDPTAPVKVSIHSLHDIMKSGTIKDIQYKSKPLEDSAEVRGEFRGLLNELITRIFDDSTPFSQADDTGACTYCQFKGMCNRITPTKD